MALRIVDGIPAILPTILNCRKMRDLLLSMATKSQRDFATIVAWRIAVKSHKQNRGTPVADPERHGVNGALLVTCTSQCFCTSTLNMKPGMRGLKSN